MGPRTWSSLRLGTRPPSAPLITPSRRPDGLLCTPNVAAGFDDFATGSRHGRPIVPTTVSAVPGLVGYMVAIVVTLGGYLAGLHWLVTPPDPWQSNPKTAQVAQQTVRKRLPPVVTPVQASATPEVTASTEPDTKRASVETLASVQASEPGTVPPTEQNPVEATRPVAEPAHIVRREVPPTKTKPINRKRVERNTSRKLELMVLRTYERSDGTRFTRLLSLNSARSALAFQPVEQW